MGYLINEKQFINDNIFKYEERISSQYSRFLDKSMTYVNYYNISNIESITDSGFLNIEAVLGPNSPLRFLEIKDLPIAGIDTILLDISDDEEGLTTSYEGEGTILPNTIKPLPNDVFTISYLNKNYLFMVTSVNFDTIKSNNFYKISFMVRSLTPENITYLKNQITENYTCISENIGTKDKCLLKSDQIDLLLKLNDIYGKIAYRYLSLFYDKRYNAMLFIDEVNNFKLYDNFLTNFINTNNLFNEKYKYETFILSLEDPYNRFILDYDTSLYRNIENNKKSKLTDNILYTLNYINSYESIFTFYRDSNIRSIKFKYGTINYIEPELISHIKNNEILEDMDILDILIVQHFNNLILSPYNLDLEKLYEFDYIDYSFNSFIKTPIILYILKSVYEKFMYID